MSYIQDFQKYSLIAEKWIDNRVCLQELPEGALNEAMRYSLMAGGKRLRPVLALAVCDILKGSRETVLPFACAIELIHTYSLIHDDLPAMDNDDFRRGKPTNHKVFGEAMAILAGDALLNLAHEIMLEELISGTDMEAKARAAALISQAAGSRGMIAGQVVDIKSEGQTIPFERLCYMHEKKTGALIKASIMASAELCGADECQSKALSLYADKIGLAFQIKDDLLDYEGNASVVGKPTGSDVRNQKSTFVTLLGPKKAKEFLKQTVEDAVKALEPLKHADFLIKTAAYIAEREK